MKKLLVAVAVALSFTVVSKASAQDAPAAPPAAASAAPDLVGSWDITTVSPMGESTNLMVVTKEADALKAVAKSDLGELPYDNIGITGSVVKIVLTIDFQGSPMIITYNGKTDGKKMEGTCDFGGLAEGTWSAVRK